MTECATKKTARYRNWMFTSFKTLQAGKKCYPIYDKETMQYMTYQLERCPTTFRDHWQGYFEFKDKISMKAIKEIMKDESIHLEIRKGTQRQAIEYCNKLDTRLEDKIYEYGTLKQQGARNDLDNIVDAIEDNCTSKEILLQFRGNALRHMGMIQRGLESYHGLGHMGALDKTIMIFRDDAQYLKDQAFSDIETVSSLGSESSKSTEKPTYEVSPTHPNISPSILFPKKCPEVDKDGKIVNYAINYTFQSDKPILCKVSDMNVTKLEKCPEVTGNTIPSLQDLKEKIERRQTLYKKRL